MAYPKSGHGSAISLQLIAVGKRLSYHSISCLSETRIDITSMAIFQTALDNGLTKIRVQ
jgi:hypothetical protein